MDDRSLAKLLLTIVVAVSTFLLACNPRETPVFKKLAEASEKEITRRTEEAIRNDPELQKLSELCNSIPREPDAAIVRKSWSANSGKTLYVYLLTETNLEDMEKIWLPHFSQNGWEVANSDRPVVGKALKFIKEGYSIKIQYGGLGSGANLAFSCSSPG
jgi:hypothetical protein